MRVPPDVTTKSGQITWEFFRILSEMELKSGTGAFCPAEFKMTVDQCTDKFRGYALTPIPTPTLGTSLEQARNNLLRAIQIPTGILT